MNKFTNGSALLAFVRAAEHGSFAAAARDAGISAAALGQSVRRLEDHFGVRLLNRSTRSMSLTPEGRMLLERARSPLKELDDIGHIFEEARGRIAGTLRLSAPIGVARHQLAAIVAAFSRHHPAVEIEIDATDTLRNLTDASIDVAIRILRPRDTTIIARKIAALSAVTMAAPDYLAQAGVPQAPRDLAKHKCIGYRYASTGRVAELQFKIHGKTMLLPFRPAITVNDVDVACEIAAQGQGIVQPPTAYIRPYVESGRLVRILPKYTATPWQLYVCYAHRRQLPLRARAFINFAVEQYRAIDLS